MAESSGIWIQTGIGFLAGIFLMYRGLHWLKRKRLIEDIPTSKARSVAMGLVEVNGKAMQATKDAIKAPLSGRKCIYYRYEVERYEQHGKSSRWVVVRKGYSPDPFYIEDNTGKVMVDPKYAELSIPESYHTESKWGKDPEKSVMDFLKKESISFEGGLFGINRSMRFREWVITEGMGVYVMGTAADNPYMEEGKAKSSAEDVIIKKGSDGIFMISSKKEKQVLNIMKWKAVGYLAGGFLLSLACLAITIKYFSVV